MKWTVPCCCVFLSIVGSKRFVLNTDSSGRSEDRKLSTIFCALGLKKGSPIDDREKEESHFHQKVVVLACWIIQKYFLSFLIFFDQKEGCFFVYPHFNSTWNVFRTSSTPDPIPACHFDGSSQDLMDFDHDDDNPF